MGIGLSMLTSLPVFDLGTTLTLGLLNLLIAFCVCYYLLVDGDRLLGATVDFLRQKKGDFELRCLGRIDGILSGIYTGSISTAMVYAIASVPIFYLFDIPRPLAMASIILLAGVVPFLTWLVFLLTAISRYIEMGPMEAAVFFFAASSGGSSRAGRRPLSSMPDRRSIHAGSVCISAEGLWAGL